MPDPNNPPNPGFTQQDSSDSSATFPVSPPVGSPPNPPGPVPVVVEESSPAEESLVVNGPSSPKRSNKGKVIAGVLGLLILVGGVATGVVLVGQRQIFQPKAANDCGSKPDGSQWICDDATEVCCLEGCKKLSEGGCGGSGTNKKCNTAGNTDAPCRGQNEGFIYCSILDGSDSSDFRNYRKRVCKAVESTGNNEYRCQNQIQTETCEIQGTPTPIPNAPTSTPSPTPKLPTIPSPESIPTPKPPTLPSPESLPAMCQSLNARDKDWNLLTSQQLTQLKAGNIVRFNVVFYPTGGGIDKARFTINGSLRPEVTALRPGTNNEFYDEYTIPAGVSAFTVKVELHRLMNDTWF